MSKYDISYPTTIKKTLPSPSKHACPLLRVLPENVSVIEDMSDDLWDYDLRKYEISKGTIFCAGNGGIGCCIKIFGIDEDGNLIAECGGWNRTVLKLKSVPEFIGEGMKFYEEYIDKYEPKEKEE